MAYKPKYASNFKRKQDIPIIRKEAVCEAPPPKKRSKGVLILFILLGILVVPVSSKVTYDLILRMYENVGRPKAAAQAKTSDMTIMDNFEVFVSEKITNTRNVLLNVDRPEIPEETEEVEIEPVRKVYWIEEDVQVAPEPDQTLFGQSSDPAALQEVLDDAKWLLDGQTTYFQPDGEIGRAHV